MSFMNIADMLDMKPILNGDVPIFDAFSLEWLDGVMLGDGGMSISGKNARIAVGVEHEEFCRYLMSGFLTAQPLIAARQCASMKSGIVWHGTTKSHPQITQQYHRWYGLGGTKQPPEDVRITPISVLLWYLGDGSIVASTKNTVMLRLSTDGFSVERVEFLASLLIASGIACHRNNENRIMVEAKGVPAFFRFIGHKSPIECYSYKYDDLPEWRFTAKRMREVADELQVDYQRLAHLVKIGRIPCYRASEKGKPRFLPEHIIAANTLITSGDLY